MPAWVAVFLVLYFLVATLLFFYGMHAYVMAVLWHRAVRRTQVFREPRELPSVTVQLPLFNERYVAKRLIDAVAAMDYPKDRLEIQVLDDSTDETVEHVAEIAEAWRRRGVDVTHIHRSDRTGFKAGALRNGLARAKGELVAVFDADFVPPATFLADTVPQFTDERVGMVQTRWGHLNEGFSLLTRTQAVALDGHFLIEQTVRNRCGAFMNFNGTAGVWRKKCILDAGNWQHDTLTEDLDLSYRAQLAGWDFVFLPDVVSPAELPSEVNGLKGQQYRWAKGSVQTAVKILPLVFRAGLPRFQRFQAVVHLTNHAVYPLLLLLGLMALPALMVLDRFPQVEGAFTAASVLVVASFGHPWLYFISQRLRGRGRREAIAMIPAVIAGGMGIAINNTRALVEGVAGRRSSFNRTPKYAIVSRGDSWRGKGYRVPFSGWSLAEVGLAVYSAAAFTYALVHGYYMVLPFLALYFLGGGYIGSLSLIHAVGQLREGRRERLEGERGLAAALSGGE
jgi:cellulose synthase/poly-beta-1,6-N-acetylglucosamine synthase-like glycosyltransferase